MEHYWRVPVSDLGPIMSHLLPASFHLPTGLEGSTPIMLFTTQDTTHWIWTPGIQCTGTNCMMLNSVFHQPPSIIVGPMHYPTPTWHQYVVHLAHCTHQDLTQNDTILRPMDPATHCMLHPTYWVRREYTKYAVYVIHYSRILRYRCVSQDVWFGSPGIAGFMFWDDDTWMHKSTYLLG